MGPYSECIDLIIDLDGGGILIDNAETMLMLSLVGRNGCVLLFDQSYDNY